MPNFPEGLMVMPPGTLIVGDRDESTKILEIVWGQVTLAFPIAAPFGVVSATAALAAIDTGKSGTWEVFASWMGGYADGMFTDIVAAIATAGGILASGLNLSTSVTASATTARTAMVLAIRH
jgi:hypothetical protein